MTGLIFFLLLLVIETHPESYVSMRIVTPWPELEQFAFDMDMAPQDTMTRAHIPMLVILIRALHHWKQEVSQLAFALVPFHVPRKLILYSL